MREIGDILDADLAGVALKGFKIFYSRNIKKDS